MLTIALAPVLTPHGRLVLAPVDDAPALPPDLSRRLGESFARGSGHGLLQLGAAEVETAVPPVLAYWREFGARYVTAVCARPHIDGGEQTSISPLPIEELETIASSAPPMTGAEYLTSFVLQTLWDAIDAAPFAFLATYTVRLSAHAKAQHLPLGRALSEYAGAPDRSQLLSLLLPVQRAAEQCP